MLKASEDTLERLGVGVRGTLTRPQRDQMGATCRLLVFMIQQKR